MPREYELIPVHVWAIELTPDSIERAKIWCGGMEVVETDALDNTKKFVALNIPTLQGVKRASQGDFIVRDVDGVIDVVSPEKFKREYRPI
jgi:hypothetical protein